MKGRSLITILLWPVFFTALGIALCFWIVPQEIITVREYLIGFPDADQFGQNLRPWLLGLLCFLPAIASWLYTASSTLDRYIARQFLAAFLLCMGTLLAIFILMDLQNNLEEFKKAQDTMGLVATYYKINIPAIFVFLLPYVLLLSLLYCLGKMSRHQEIVSMIQTGRGVLRIVAPLIITGFFASVICLIFNYHWGPWAEGNKDIILDMAKNGKANRAHSVLYRDKKSRRVWLIGSFPYQFEKSGEIRHVTVKEFDKKGNPTTLLQAQKATWSRDKKQWTFSKIILLQLTTQPIPLVTKYDTLLKNWHETPWQLVKPGLDQSHLGIPELNSWLKANEGVEWANRLPYLTQWHYRLAQPVICLITILLAAPLGIVFSRRGIGGGVSIALFLSAGMLFFSTIFLTLGEAGYIPPALAAWSTNIIFAAIALYLFKRRLTGRPIYQSIYQGILKFFPTNN